MNHTMNIFLISDECRAVMVAYDPDRKENGKTKGYMFKTLDKRISVGDMVVIPTNSRVEMTVGEVLETDVDPDFDSNIEVKWIIDLVDVDSYQETLDKEIAANEVVMKAEKRRRRDELRKSVLADSQEELKGLPIYNVKDVPPAIGND